MTEIKRGTRVRVTYEGVVTFPVNEQEWGIDCHQVKPDAAPNVHAFAPVGSIEVLEPPKPEYEVGAIYTSEHGCRYLRTHGGWRQITKWRMYPERPESEYEGCSFIKLVPEVTA